MKPQKQRAARADPKAEQWAEAKRLCRLSARRIEMAKALGMNPKKLPGLRPSKSQQWKTPVGQFSEDCYVERFGNPPSANISGRSAKKNETAALFRIDGLIPNPCSTQLEHELSWPDDDDVPF